MLCFRFLNELRAAELDALERYLARDKAILELGGGTGEQARLLTDRGYRVESIDLPQSIYAGDRVFPVVDYDGRTIPFADARFDIVFSSNVLEHVLDLEGMYRELDRVLGPDGIHVHAMPTGRWRFWTTLSNYADMVERIARQVPGLIPRGVRRADLSRCYWAARSIATVLLTHAWPPRHGERGTMLGELWTFSPWWWRRHFRQHGFEILSDAPVGLFYTGHMVLGRRWPVPLRRRLARWLGSACHVYVLRRATSR
ncbi:MAG: class I SAM-dependent methyltransferase [Ectothiorhodospiraceae bacterium]|nr:class I SAM-dependent methyltransferase [Chromatiales bacterium]MCP5155640.1 class I SAM-dependent methyltransferase [Ectothiorhodospiraceae bacterium]